MSAKKQIFFLLLLVLVLAGCAKRPKEVLSRSKMRKVLVELHKADGVINTAGYTYNEERKNKYYESVLADYGVTQADFDSSIVWYSRNPKVFEKIYISVVEDLQAEFNQLSMYMQQSGYIVPTEKPELAFLDSIRPHFLQETAQPQRMLIDMLMGTHAAADTLKQTQFALRSIYIPELQDSIFVTLSDTTQRETTEITFSQPKPIRKPNALPVDRQRLKIANPK